jgi:hypothetical protein
VLKELVDPLGARIQLRSIPVGDPTLSGTDMTALISKTYGFCDSAITR